MTLIESVRFAFSCMDRATRKNVVISVFLLALTSSMEILGIGLVFPVIQLLPAETLEGQHELVQLAAKALAVESPDTLALIGVIALVAVLGIKGVSAVLVQAWSTRRLLEGQYRATANLYSAYLKADLAWHNRNNSAAVLHRLNHCCNVLFGTVPTNCVTIFSDVILSLGMVILLVTASPVAALISLAFGAFGVILNNKVLSVRIRDLTKERDEIARLSQGLVLESKHGIQDVRVLACEPYFFTRYRRFLDRLTDLFTKMKVLALLPRYSFELIAGVFILIVFVVITETLDRAAVVPTLALYVVTALRLLPTVARMTAQVSMLRTAIPSAMELAKDREAFGQNLFKTAMVDDTAVARDRQRLPLEQGMELENICFNYLPGEPILNNMNMTIARGQCVGIVGPSGAGKSTIIGLLLGFFAPISGRILIDGKALDPDLSAYERSIGFVQQAVFVADSTVRENVAFGEDPADIDDARIWTALEMANIDAFVRELPDGLDTQLSEHGSRISGGQRQRLGIARALYHEPEMLILDEATSSLDLETEAQISQVISSLRGRKTIVIIAHRLSTVKDCDMIYFVKDGTVAGKGTFESLQKSNAEFRALVELGDLQSAAQ